jgi:hypothetical protein
MRAKKSALVVAGCLLALAGIQLAAQSLGDVAKKEEERRKAAPAAGKVYTNKDLAPVPPSSTPPPPDSGSTAGDSAAAGSDKAADAKAAADKDKEKDKGKGDAKDSGASKDQAYWRGRMKAALESIERDTTLADAMQSRINALTTDFVNRDDPAQRTKIESERQKAMSELDRLKKQITADRKAVTDTEEEARRAGVPPGWLR